MKFTFAIILPAISHSHYSEKATKKKRSIEMLGLKYVVAKSKELQIKLERTTGATGSSSNTAGNSASPSSRYSARSARSTSSTTAASTAATEATESENAARSRGVSSPTFGRNEGDEFLQLQQKQWEKALVKHEQLLDRCVHVDWIWRNGVAMVHEWQAHEMD